MNIFHLVLLAVSGSLVSLAGGILLVSNRKLAGRVAVYGAPFAAGALIAAVFFDLIPEALELSNTEPSSTLLWAVVGIIGFFLLERRLRWFHHHHEHDGDKEEGGRLPPMLIVGDTLHNALDGMAIGFAYLADPALGVVTTLAVALHELPQEIGDFGLLLKAGWSRRSVLIANIFSALATVAAALTVYFIGDSIDGMVPGALALTGGALIYLALSDVIPTVHEIKPRRKWFDIASLLVVTGMILVWLTVQLAHGWLHNEEPHTHEVINDSHHTHEH